MSKTCAKCDKTVYPLEELKCLDKVWHKSCFKCQECGMTLSMRNYKGFNRLPYCTAHCPQAKHTTVADTPEIRRIQENTKIQSTVKYHEEFEKQKGKVTQIADDPETLRIKQNTRIISNVAYHGDLERKAQMEQKRPPMEEREDGDNHFYDDELKSTSPINSVVDPPAVVATNQAQGVTILASPSRNPTTKVVEMEPPALAKDSPYSSRQTSTVIYTSEHGPVSNPPTRPVGSIADYDPINDNYGSVASAVQQQQFRIAGDRNTPQSPRAINNRKFRAMYDYMAADSDEVSFLDGDIIVNCTPVDEGWMTGMVQRTGEKGMLPANYVEPVN